MANLVIHRANLGASCQRSAQSSVSWASHDIPFRHEGIKRLRPPVVGELEMAYQSLALRLSRAQSTNSVFTRQNGEPPTRNGSDSSTAGLQQYSRKQQGPQPDPSRPPFEHL
ncbi:hypothetical protein AB6813_21900 [bacterium RCC_150]